MTSKKPAARLDFVDALRGFAALYVVFCHLVFIPHPALAVPQWLRPSISNGTTGVTLFFVVSAFTLCYTLAARAGEPRRLVSFYLRRIFRIVPLYYVWLFVMAYSHWGRGTIHHWREMLLYGCFGFNFLPAHQEGLVWASWTLGVEMVFYMIFPVLFWIVNSLLKAVLFLAFSLFVSWIQYLHTRALVAPGVNTEHFIYLNFFHQLPVFALGMVIYFIWRKFPLSAKPALSRLLLAVGIGGCIFLPYVLNGRFPLLDIYFMALIYGALFLGFSAIPVRPLVNKTTVFLGVISYSLYLNHPQFIYRSQSVFHFIYSKNLPPLTQLGLCYGYVLILLTALSSLTYLLVEQPGIRIGSRLIKHLRAGNRIAESNQVTALTDLQR